MNLQQAMILVQAYVGTQNRISACDHPANGTIYGFNASNQYLFAVMRPDVKRIGGSEYVLVDKRTKNVTTEFAGD